MIASSSKRKNKIWSQNVLFAQWSSKCDIDCEFCGSYGCKPIVWLPDFKLKTSTDTQTHTHTRTVIYLCWCWTIIVGMCLHVQWKPSRNMCPHWALDDSFYAFNVFNYSEDSPFYYFHLYFFGTAYSHKLIRGVADAILLFIHTMADKGWCIGSTIFHVASPVMCDLDGNQLLLEYIHTFIPTYDFRVRLHCPKHSIQHIACLAIRLNRKSCWTVMIFAWQPLSSTPFSPHSSNNKVSIVWWFSAVTVC